MKNKDSISELQELQLIIFTDSIILNIDELKFLIDSSLIRLFGTLAATKIKYSIKKDQNLNFILKTFKKYYLH